MIHENVHTKHSVFTAPDVHMHTSLSYTCEHTTCKLGSRTSDQFITSIGEERDRDRHRQTEVHTDRQTERQTETETTQCTLLDFLAKYYL